MPYDMQIDRANPGCIVFLVDLSNSMLDGIAGTPRAKMDTVSTAINRFFQELITSCEKGEEKPRNYFDVGLIGYTTDSNGVAIVRPLFKPSAMQRQWGMRCSEGINAPFGSQRGSTLRSCPMTMSWRGPPPCGAGSSSWRSTRRLTASMGGWRRASRLTGSRRQGSTSTACTIGSRSTPKSPLSGRPTRSTTG